MRKYLRLESKVGFLLSLFFLFFLSGCSKDDASEPLSSDEQEVIERVDKINAVIEPVFTEAESVEDLIPYMEELEACEEVQNAWVESDALYVQVKDGGIVTWAFPPEEEEEFPEMRMRMDSLMAQFKEAMQESRMKGSRADEHLCTNKNLCIINQQSSDLSREMFQQYYESLSKDFEDVELFESITMVTQKDFTARFIVEEMPSYGAIFLASHGGMVHDSIANRNVHWFLTGEEFDVDKDKFDLWRKNELMAAYVGEKRSGFLKDAICYLAVSEDFIRNRTRKSYSPNSILFNTSCQSLKKDDNLAKAFLSKGLGCYLGYTETNAVGKLAGLTFYEYMLLYATDVSKTLYLMPAEYLKDRYKGLGAKLKAVPDGSKISFFKEGELSKDRFVDLGLSVRWASCNLDALKPEQLGSLHKGMDPLDVYKKDSTLCKVMDEDDPVITFWDLVSVDICGSDLDPATQKNFGRLPSKKEMQELVTKCKISADVVNDVGGIRVEGPNGNAIFIPASTSEFSGSYMFEATYWAGTYDKDDSSMSFASLYFVGNKTGNFFSKVFPEIDQTSTEGYIRPVSD